MLGEIVYVFQGKIMKGTCSCLTVSFKGVLGFYVLIKIYWFGLFFFFEDIFYLVQRVSRFFFFLKGVIELCLEWWETQISSILIKVERNGGKLNFQVFQLRYLFYEENVRGGVFNGVRVWSWWPLHQFLDFQQNQSKN
eukprot:TRINITY_DN20923_c0_g1_i1.p1 TRINITY_DN20923_c0_g1~~TRINITY_DN20923_c0_g1_i1.p1  ORF type:complete len:138 (+),score=18.24 TRINITY_DN20923_c0_g1_i1:269-682(+)